MFKKKIKALVFYIALFISKMRFYLEFKARKGSLLTKKVTDFAKYLDFVDVFSRKLTKILLKQTKVNEYVIKFEKSKKAIYVPIYSSKQIEFKPFIIYIKTNQAKNSIGTLKSQTHALILNGFKFNCSFCFCVNY